MRSEWVPIRIDKRGGLHCIVQPHHWLHVEGAQDIIVDVDLEDATVDLEEVLHRLVARRHAEMRDDENEEMQQAVTDYFEEQKSQTKRQTATSGAKDTDGGREYKRSRAAGPAPRTRQSSAPTSKGS